MKIKLTGNYFTNLKISKELVKQISYQTGESYEDICFNLLVTLDQKVTQKNIDAYNRPAFGLHRVIKYQSTEIKAKCKIVFIRDKNHGNKPGFDGVNIDIVPQTGQWIRMDNKDINPFLEKKTQELVGGILLGAETSLEAPSPQQLSQGHIAPAEPSDQTF